MNPFRLVVTAAVFSLLVGCGPSWKVVRTSSPSALKGAGEVAIAFDYSQMNVGGRAVGDFVAAKTAEDPKYPQTWADLLGRFETAVIDGMRHHNPHARAVQAGGPTPVMLIVQPRTFQLGKFIPFAQPNTVMDVELVWQVNGQVTDEIGVKRAYPPSITQPSVFNHIGPVGEGIGQTAGKFLDSAQ
jgi:hypothetical protein